VLAAGRVVADGTPAQIRTKAGVRDGVSLDKAFLALTDLSVATETEH
jgi:ABC-2 type transport system ATP-binding protein